MYWPKAPRNVDAIEGRSKVFAAMGDNRRAEAEFEKARKIYQGRASSLVLSAADWLARKPPTKIPFLCNRPLIKPGDPREKLSGNFPRDEIARRVIKDLTKVIAYLPRHPKARVVRARAYIRFGLFEEAKSDLDVTLAIDQNQV